MKNAKKPETLLLCCVSELAIIIFVFIANLFDNFIYAVFYNLLYRIGVD